jgi:hypothetical protein
MRLINQIFTAIATLLILLILITLFPILTGNSSATEYFSSNDALRLNFLSILANLTLAYMIYHATKRSFDIESRIWFDIFLQNKDLMLKSISRQGLYLYKYKLTLEHSPNNAHVRNQGNPKQKYERAFAVPIHMPAVLSNNSEGKIFEIDLLRDRSKDEKDEIESRISIYHSYTYSVGDEYSFKLILYFKTYDHEKRKIIIEGTANIDSDLKLEFSKLKIPRVQ